MLASVSPLRAPVHKHECQSFVKEPPANEDGQELQVEDDGKGDDAEDGSDNKEGPKCRAFREDVHAVDSLWRQALLVILYPRRGKWER